MQISFFHCVMRFRNRSGFAYDALVTQANLPDKRASRHVIEWAECDLLDRRRVKL